MGVSEDDEEGNVFDALAAADRRPQDSSPIITSRSIMVGERSNVNVDDSYHSQDSVTNLVNSQNKTVNFEETSTTSSPQRRRSSLNQSTSSRDQAFSAAQRTRERSEAETLAHPVADAGLNAFGCVFIEVWVMSDDGTKLTRPEGGHWMDPAFAQSLPDESLIEKAWELDREARDCPPGAGLAGTLAEEAGLGGVKVHWRQIKSLLDDPFVQRGSGKRMEKLVELGVGLVAAVPFQFQEQRGLVLYYARSTAKTELLRAPSNERYMKASADLIGANICIRKARQESANFRKSMFKEAVRKAKTELLGKDSKSGFASMILNEEDMKKLKLERDHAQDEDELHLPRVDRFCVKMGKMVVKFGKKAVKRTKNSVRKWRGAKLHGPPRQSLTDAWYSFLGAFLTMLTILKISISIGDSSTYAFDGGWYASTLCIIYALTPAPVGQPRQIFAAHLWNMLVALAIRQIPSNEAEFMDWSSASYGLPLIWKQALSVGLGIAGQAYIGILHPPATGLSNTFVVKDKFGWGTMASVMVTDCVVVTISMMILNLEEKKQWPLYWLGLGWEGSGGTIGKVKAQGRSVRRSAKQSQNSIKRRVGSSSKREKMNGDEAV